jgi:tetratricopeptide (TPR) repeat protein
MLTQQQRVAGMSPDMARRSVAIAQMLAQRRLNEAEQGAIAALALAPRHPEILRLFGMIQFMRGQHEAAIDTLLQARAQRPDDPFIHNALGGAYEAILDFPKALVSFQRACELGPELASCWFNLGKLMFVCGDVEGAIDPLQRAVALEPGHVYARTMLANILRADGRFEEARGQFRKIVAQNPESGQAWWGLATLKPMSLDAADIARMQTAMRGTAAREVDKDSIGFALATALDHQGDFAQAFAVLEQTHARMRRKEIWNAPEKTARIDAIVRAFATSVTCAEPAQGEEVIFITSMPRSGSTLTEQILASHSNVQGTSELPHLLALIMEESDRRRSPFPDWVHAATPADWHRLGQQYLERTQRLRRQRPRFTDKMPGNWMYVGAILAMLPKARVIIVRRDPLETCFGCYRYLFNRHPYTHDFNDLAECWRQFDRAARHWRQMYPDRVREQVYEELQTDPETQIRELLAFCNLEFEESCLNFHTTERRVTTPSAAQVREPLRRDTARAAKYGALLDPLRAALGLN